MDQVVVGWFIVAKRDRGSVALLKLTVVLHGMFLYDRWLLYEICTQGSYVLRLTILSFLVSNILYVK